MYVTETLCIKFQIIIVLRYSLSTVIAIDEPS